jgi:hypothetical protein
MSWHFLFVLEWKWMGSFNYSLVTNYIWWDKTFEHEWESANSSIVLNYTLSTSHHKHNIQWFLIVKTCGKWHHHLWSPSLTKKEKNSKIEKEPIFQFIFIFNVHEFLFFLIFHFHVEINFKKLAHFGAFKSPL